MTQDRKEQRYPDIDAMLEDVYKAFPEKEYLEKGDLVLSSEPLRAERRPTRPRPSGEGRGEGSAAPPRAQERMRAASSR